MKNLTNVKKRRENKKKHCIIELANYAHLYRHDKYIYIYCRESLPKKKL